MNFFRTIIIFTTASSGEGVLVANFIRITIKIKLMKSVPEWNMNYNKGAGEGGGEVFSFIHIKVYSICLENIWELLHIFVMTDTHCKCL